MSRFLFVVPPLTGHINPTVGVAAELTRRGHEVAWAGLPDVVGAVAGADCRVFACAAPVGGGLTRRDPGLRGPAALRFLWAEFLIPLAEAMIPGVRAAVDAFGPDVLVADQQTIAGAVVAVERGVVWATSATTSAELADSLGGMPKVTSWMSSLVDSMLSRAGSGVEVAATLGIGRPVDPRFSPHLVLVFTTTELAGQLPDATGVTRFVGPSIAPRPEDAGFPWEWLQDPRPTILVTLGTVNADAGGRFLAECLRAVGERQWLRAVVVDPDGTAGLAPPNVLLVPRVPQLRLLPMMRAVVCHAGHNTVCEALFHGLPLVVAPIRDDQPIVAQQVVDAGAGVRLRFGRAGAAQIGAAVDDVLTSAAYTEGAARVQQSFRAAGGVVAAADHLEALVPS